MKKNLIILFFGLAGTGFGQTNTAITSGSIGKCKVWNYPYTLYNTSTASQTVNNGVTVTVDQDRNIGAVNLIGSGAMDMSGSNGITLSGSGAQITCRWDISRTDSHTLVNNNGNSSAAYFQNWGTFFTAPYSGNYLWLRGSGWSASMSGPVLNGTIKIFKNNDGLVYKNIFYQNQSNTCTASAEDPPSWENSIGPITMNPGETLQYGSRTQYNEIPACTGATLSATAGNATLMYDN